MGARDVGLIALAFVVVSQIVQSQVAPARTPSEETMQKVRTLKELQQDTLTLTETTAKSAVNTKTSVDIEKVNSELDRQISSQRATNFTLGATAVISKLRESGVDQAKLSEIEAANTKAQSSGSDDDRARVAELMADAAKLSPSKCEVAVSTAKTGAFVRYQSWAEHRDHGIVHTLGGLPTNDAKDRLDLGFYFVWTERGGKPTSDQSRWYAVAGSSYPIEIEELP